MYEEFYGVREKPFSIQPDPEFLFFGRRHRLAYAILEYSIQNKAGFAVICGEVGCGKTTLVRQLLNQLGPEVTVGLVYNTHPDIADPLEWIMLAFGQPYKGFSSVELYDAFQQFLIAEHIANRSVVLIVDEAQNLNPSALEFLRMLSNINADKDQMLQVILVGQPELNDLLDRPDMRQFAQRVSAHFFIPPIEPKEAISYIHHRISVAGREERLFTDRACLRIAEAAEHIPRSINILCDTALVYGFSAGVELIDIDLVDEMLEDRATYGAINTGS